MRDDNAVKKGDQFAASLLGLHDFVEESMQSGVVYVLIGKEEIQAQIVSEAVNGLTTGTSPFEVIDGRTPNHIADLVDISNQPRVSDDVVAFVENLKEIQEGVRQRFPAVVRVREMKTRSGSYFRFLVKWMGKPDCANSWISEEEFMKIDPEKCQAAKMATHLEDLGFEESTLWHLPVTMDIVTRFFHAESCDIHLNHGDLLDAIWSWTGIKPEHRQKVAELLSMMASLRPQSSERKSKWVVIRRQLLQLRFRREWTGFSATDDSLGTISGWICSLAAGVGSGGAGSVWAAAGVLSSGASSVCAIAISIWDVFSGCSELNLAEAVVNRLQTVGLRFCGAADQALPRLRGALPSDKPTRKALDELSDLFSYLRIWRIEKHVYIDALMPPTESYHRDLFFQIFLMKENNPGSLIEGALLAIGGRYDYLLHQMWDREYVGYAPRTNPPGAVGTSLALETIIQHSPVDFKPIRNETSTSVLVCSRGGGGLLVERMELVAELWEENIKAQFVPIPDPSLTEQYEYASEHDIKCLVIITDTGLSQTGFVKGLYSALVGLNKRLASKLSPGLDHLRVKGRHFSFDMVLPFWVRHLEVKKEKEVKREDLVRFLLDATATQFRKSSLWN
ncbi:hypothetical protein JRO89_XS03G0018000 [Xanthoceras sorbifolium]|uniref:Chromo domain-containing protein n=1 Tax=Xanthoceras sorbifolium TaxID=99658 RepID=A0ABQ8I853_9ROSI|nr:hypothetical protein JRO89_XS03G0018000 [Xanthoceras sorbifolium]